MKEDSNKKHQEAEVKGPDEMDSDKGEGVTVPEEFQSKAHSLVCDADHPCLDHLSSKISSRKSELYENERKAKKKGKGDEDDMMSEEGMPATSY